MVLLKQPAAPLQRESQMTSPLETTVQYLTKALPRSGSLVVLGASAAPSQLLLYIQRTLDSPAVRLCLTDDIYHPSKLDTASGATCILPSVTSGEERLQKQLAASR